LVLGISGAITVVDQMIHGQATVFLLGAVGTALAVYLPVRVSVLAFGGVSGIVLAFLPLVQPDPDVLTGHLINIILVTAVAITANSTLYRQAVRTVRHLKLIDDQRKELDRLASEDDLTGVANRRYGDRRIREELARYYRYERPFSLCFGDLDHFKLVNDRYSHSVGDRVLKKVAELLQIHLRDVDVVVRYGGEEFVVLLPETFGHEAAGVCEKLRTAIAAYDWELHSPGLEITMSFGVADCTEGDDAAAILQLADERLYRAKERGRNRVEASGV
jgi:diguanylate cyclase (GGDEF)-like protein